MNIDDYITDSVLYGGVDVPQGSIQLRNQSRKLLLLTRQRQLSQRQLQSSLLSRVWNPGPAQGAIRVSFALTMVSLC
jgi:hypothetical protein